MLVVDDNAVNRRILREMLANWRMQPAVVASGRGGDREMLRAARAGTPFPLVILDGMMPEMDGFMVAEKIQRTRGALRRDGDDALLGDAGRRRRALRRAGSGGLPHQAGEPVRAARCDPHRDPLADGRERSPQRRAAPTARRRVGLRILLAEDNVINRALATGILEKRGHSLVHAANGREAVEAAATRSFDLIFMDVQMPEMDGLEATRRIRESGSKRPDATPRSSAMTAHAMAGDRERCLAAGMDDYISKPLRKEDLLRVLHGLEVTADSEETHSPILTRPRPSSGDTLVNIDQLRNVTDNEPAKMRRLIDIYLTQAAPMLDELNVAIRDQFER